MKKNVLLISIVLLAVPSSALKTGNIISVPDGSECVRLGARKYICRTITIAGQKNCFSRDGEVKTEAECEEFDKVANTNE